MSRGRVILDVLALLAFAGGALSAQQAGEWDPDRVVATRTGLEQLKSRLLLAAQSTAYSPGLRARATSEAAGIDRRLAEGDFRPGDRIYLLVQGETGFPDTFAVGPARDVTVPTIGVIPLAGVLRADIEPYFKKYVATFLRNPTVRAQPLIPISVLGKVGRAGFFTVPTGIPLTQVLNIAGGPTSDAEIRSISIEREGRTIWGGDALQRAITDGRTLEQLGLRAGDRVIVPGGNTDLYKVVQTLSYALGIPLAIFSVVQLFKGK